MTYNKMSDEERKKIIEGAPLQTAKTENLKTEVFEEMLPYVSRKFLNDDIDEEFEKYLEYYSFYSSTNKTAHYAFTLPEDFNAMFIQHLKNIRCTNRSEYLRSAIAKYIYEEQKACKENYLKHNKAF